ncbi:MAG: B12-binding domain-containing protein [Woeseiaceae bacterium]|nr:B12-binding domain-containing protein [Woeseiaceae bacterium]
MLQPTLYEIGRRFEAGEISVAEEHRVSQFVQASIDAVEARGAGTDAKPQVLLATAPGNTHTIGTRFLAKALNEAGIPVEVMLGACRRRDTGAPRAGSLSHAGHFDRIALADCRGRCPGRARQVDGTRSCD